MKIFIPLVFIFTFALFVYLLSLWKNTENHFVDSPKVTKIIQPYQYKFPQVKKRQDYAIFLVGDSMTALFGPYADQLKANLKKYYPQNDINTQNYSAGSTNILSVKERLFSSGTYEGVNMRPILNERIDLLILESFGHNPSSELSLEEGLKKQELALDEIVKTFQEKSPQTGIIFLATIAPNRNRYGEGTVDLSPEKRQEWADERTTYIKNHISYAKKHNIPVINVYEKSLKDGDGNIDYIESRDFIHPSSSGINFLSQEIADFIYQNNLLPK